MELGLLALRDQNGSYESTTDWVALSQLEVDMYGALIGDLDPMHNDPNWPAGRERWGGTIVIGSHVMSMLPEFLRRHGFPVRTPGVQFTPVALPRLRFTAPLRVGGRARDHLRILDLAEARPNVWKVHTHHTVEREKLEKPFMVAELVAEYCEA